VSRFQRHRRALAGVAVTAVLGLALALVARLQKSSSTEPVSGLAGAPALPLADAPERSVLGISPLPAPIAPSPGHAPTAVDQAVAPLAHAEPRLHPILAPVPATAADSLQSRSKPAPTPHAAAPGALSAEPTSPAQPAVAEPAPEAQPGLLNFDSDPWAQVFLDTKELGTTPLRQVSLPPGRHVLTLRNPELGISTTYVVNVPPGGKVSRFVGWSKQ